MNHVCLVSDQPMPNFLPVLNPELRPDSVTLVVSSRMKSRADWLRTEIGKQQVRVLDDIEIGEDVSDITSIQNILMDWADRNPELMASSVLNVTGGTKPMAIAAQEVFRMAERDVFYVDVASDRVAWVSNVQDGLLLTNQPTLGQFFGLNGIVPNGDFKSELENEKWRHFYEEIACNVQFWAQAIGGLAKWAAHADETGKYARSGEARTEALGFRYEERERNLDNWQELLELLHNDELIVGAYGKERFRTPAAARFCAGGWLEHLVFVTLKKLGFDKKHALMNVEIRDAKGNPNELDSIVLHRNNCFVIEDKTRNMKIGKLNNAADNAIYKLAHLTRQMGLRAHGILVSARPVRKADRDRAMADNVSVIDYLPNLESELKRIIGC